MNNEFAELNASEMNDIDGGKWYHVVGGVVGGVGGVILAEAIARDLQSQYNYGYNQGRQAAGK